VLLRADLNVPLDTPPGGAPVPIADPSRITAVLPTLRLLLSAGARVVLASHLGRPKPGGAAAPGNAAFSLAPVAARLTTALGPDAFSGLCPHLTGPEAEAAVAALRPGQALLLENTRFHAGDEKGDEALGRALAALVSGASGDQEKKEKASALAFIAPSTL
jgi:phosphoglycerate kinase